VYYAPSENLMMPADVRRRMGNCGRRRMRSGYRPRQRPVREAADVRTRPGRLSSKMHWRQCIMLHPRI